MEGRAVVRVHLDGTGRLVYDELRSTALVMLRRAAGSLYLASRAATPLGGDRMVLDIELGPGVPLTVRSVSAAVARRGEGASSVIVSAQIAAGASLVWDGAPGVSAHGSDHHAIARITVEPGGRCWWREEIVLGRSGEAPGRWRSQLQVDRGSAPVLRHEITIGSNTPAAASPAVIRAARVVTSVLGIGVETVPASVVEDLAGRATVLPLATGSDLLVTVLAAGHLDALRLLGGILADLGDPFALG